MITVNGSRAIEWKPGITLSTIREMSGFRDGPYAVILDGRVVPQREYDTYPVPENASIRIVYIVQGG